MNTIENIIIIGGGPAGHTAAIYAAKALLNPLMLEGFMAGGVPPGGQLTTTTEVENFPGFPEGVGGLELMKRMRQQSINHGTRIETITVESVDLNKNPFKIIAGGKEYLTKSLIVATGATAKRLRIPGENKLWQRGISACAVCDGGLPIFREQRLVVIGGGDVACEEALYLTKFGSEVIMLVRRDEFRASKAMQERVFKHEKITIMRNTEALECIGEKVLEKLKIINNKTQEESTLECKGLFYAIGHQPNTEFLQGQIAVDQEGYIITEKGSPKTSVKGVFAAGDVQDKVYRQAITSAGVGCMAALEAEKILEEQREKEK